jgi:hypothetical protein
MRIPNCIAEYPGRTGLLNKLITGVRKLGAEAT